MISANPLATLVRTAIDDFRKEAAERRRITAVDPVADTLAHVASDLADRLKHAEAASEPLTAEQYGAQPHVHARPQTVRKWCRLGQLPGAMLTEAGWRIPREAKRVRPARRAARRAPDGERAVA